MPLPRTLLFAGATLALIAGCTEDTSAYREVGAPPPDAEFGAAVNNNIAYHTGEKTWVIDLAQRFNREVPDTVTFAFNSAALDAQARATLARQASFIRQFPEATFRVFGHTDAVGSDSYNRRLGMRRANAVVHYLVTHGVSRARLEATVSHGETQPLIVTENRERRNRRTVTEVSGFVEDNPLIMDGKYAQVVYREYVESGTEEPRFSLAGPDSLSHSESP